MHNATTRSKPKTAQNAAFRGVSFGGMNDVPLNYGNQTLKTESGAWAMNRTISSMNDKKSDTHNLTKHNENFYRGIDTMIGPSWVVPRLPPNKSKMLLVVYIT